MVKHDHDISSRLLDSYCHSDKERLSSTTRIVSCKIVSYRQFPCLVSASPFVIFAVGKLPFHSEQLFNVPFEMFQQLSSVVASVEEILASVNATTHKRFSFAVWQMVLGTKPFATDSSFFSITFFSFVNFRVISLIHVYFMKRERQSLSGRHGKQ